MVKSYDGELDLGDLAHLQEADVAGLDARLDERALADGHDLHDGRTRADDAAHRVAADVLDEAVHRRLDDGAAQHVLAPGLLFLQRGQVGLELGELAAGVLAEAVEAVGALQAQVVDLAPQVQHLHLRQQALGGHRLRHAQLPAQHLDAAAVGAHRVLHRMLAGVVGIALAPGHLGLGQHLGRKLERASGGFGSQARDLRLQRDALGLALGLLRLVAGRVEHGQRLALLHLLAFVHHQLVQEAAFEAGDHLLVAFRHDARIGLGHLVDACQRGPGERRHQHGGDQVQDPDHLRRGLDHLRRAHAAHEGVVAAARASAAGRARECGGGFLAPEHHGNAAPLRPPGPAARASVPRVAARAARPDAAAPAAAATPA